jgi:hypothetical protein
MCTCWKNMYHCREQKHDYPSRKPVTLLYELSWLIKLVLLFISHYNKVFCAVTTLLFLCRIIFNDLSLYKLSKPHSWIVLVSVVPTSHIRTAPWWWWWKPKKLKCFKMWRSPMAWSSYHVVWKSEWCLQMNQKADGMVYGLSRQSFVRFPS